MNDKMTILRFQLNPVRNRRNELRIFRFYPITVTAIKISPIVCITSSVAHFRFEFCNMLAATVNPFELLKPESN